LNLNTKNMEPNLRFKVFVFVLLCLASAQLQAQKIGLLLDSYISDRWYLDQKLFMDKVRELGGTPLLEVAYGDTVEQLRLGKKLIDEGVNVLVIVPTNAKQAAQIVAVAKAANVPVLDYDRLIFSPDISVFISYDNEKVGKLQAQYALSKVPVGNYILVNGPVSDNNAILYRQGQLGVLAPSIKNGKVKVLEDFVMGDWGELGALMKLDDYFSSNKKKPDVIIAANDALANGVVQALPKEFTGKIVITGQDADLPALKNIIAGNQSMTIYKSIKPVAQLAAQVAMKLAKGEPITGTTKLKNGNGYVDAILLDPVVVDKGNFTETVVKDGHVNLSEIMEH